MEQGSFDMKKKLLSALINACIFGVIIENNMEVRGEKFINKNIFDCKVLKIIKMRKNICVKYS